MMRSSGKYPNQHNLQVYVEQDLYAQVRAAASGGSPVMPKRAMQTFIVKSLRAALAQQPRKLKLCARCVKENLTLVKSVAKVAPAEAGGVAGESPFSHLLGELAVEGLAGPSPVDLSFCTEVSTGLFVGSDMAWAGGEVPEGWSILSAGKEPWHREMVGYKSAGAPQGSEFFAARRGNHMALNFINCRKLGPNGETYVAPEMLQAGLEFLKERSGDKVLIIGGSGKSRAPFMAYLFLKDRMTLEEFRSKCDFDPGAGIQQYLKEHA